MTASAINLEAALLLTRIENLRADLAWLWEQDQQSAWYSLDRYYADQSAAARMRAAEHKRIKAEIHRLRCVYDSIVMGY